MVIVEFLDEEGNKVDEKQGKNFEEHYTKRPGKSYDISAAKLKQINDQNNDYWSDLLGKRINFQIGEIDVAYTTLSDTGLIRNQYLSSLFLNPPVVVDAYAGCGMDSISFLYDLYWKDGSSIKRLYIVENGGQEEEERNNRLIRNVQKFIDARDLHTDGLVDFCLWGTENFFRECKNFKRNPVSAIDLLYLDPPWTVPDRKNSGENGEATPQELMDYIYDTILNPLIEQGIHVRVVCIKTRFDWDRVSNIIELLRKRIRNPVKQFVHRSTIKCQPFRGVYYFHTISTMEPEVGEWEGTAVFKKAYEDPRQIRNGKKTRSVNDRSQYERDLVLLDPQRRRDLTAIVGALHERISQLELQEANPNI